MSENTSYSQTKDQRSFLFLTTKVVPPRPSLRLVQRERLLEALDAACHARLVLLSSSAGSGKTTLLSTWAERLSARSRKVAWLSLDEMDNDPTHFWTAVLVALRTCFPTFGEAALALLHSPQPAPISTLLTMLINELQEEKGEIALLLDDYQVIEEKTIHEAIAFLIDHLPANLHLTLASRSDPDLPLARWRTRRQLLELRDVDLSFTPEETSMFLTHALPFPVSAAEIGQLHIRTEGWIAGLQLATLALGRQKDRAAFLQAFTGNHRYLMDYVQQEILTHLPEPLQQFLLQISVLPRMNAELCQTITGEDGSQAFLETLERQNLFLIPLDEERRWYRLHDLFREVLLARFQASRPELVPILYRRTASFYEAQGEIRQAVVFALAARDYTCAATLMEQSLQEIWLRGETQTLYRWMMALPDEVVPAHARLMLTAALYLSNSSASTTDARQSNMHMQVELLLTRVEAALRDPGKQALQADEMAVLQRRLRLMFLYSSSIEALRKVDGQRFGRLAQQILQLEQDEDELWQTIPLGAEFIHFYSFKLEAGAMVAKLQEAKKRVRQTQDLYATIKVMQWLVLALLSAGKLRQALQECQEALAFLRAMKGHAIWAGYFSVCLMRVFLEWNRLDEMSALIQQTIHEATLWQQMDLYTAGHWYAAQYALAVGNLTRADQELQEVERLQQEQVASNFTAWSPLLRVEYWLAAGNLSVASAWAEQAILSEESWNSHHRYVLRLLVRVFCARAEYARAVELLDRFGRYLEPPGDMLGTIAVLALSFMALHHVGEKARASQVAARLLALTAPDGFLRVYLDLGEPMRQALQELLDSPPPEADFARAYVSTLLAAFEQDNHTRGAMTVSLDQQELAPRPQPGLVEPLSPQELRVLRLLVAGRSNPEIADALMVSVNTIKTQVQSIYRKLGVANRVEASASARDLQLL